MKVEESLNVTFIESPPPTKSSPLVDDDVGEEEAIENNIKVVNNNNIEEESIEVDEGNISNEKVSSEDNLADILTKPLEREQFNYLRLGLGMMEHIPDGESPSSKK
ncbi:hypothetical protein Tco_1444924 [Tanacetum coccineum]